MQTDTTIETDGILVKKAWYDGNDVFIEGWVSKPGRDRQKHSTTPESLIGSLPDYFQRLAPISAEDHQLGKLPMGHHQRGVLLRDGKVLLECEHPTDPAPFKSLPKKGSGWWGRARITHQVGIDQVQKGNVGSFSYTGHVKAYNVLLDGTWEYERVDPLVETTLTAFPVKTDANFQISKSEKDTTLDETQLETILMGILDKREAAKKVETDATELIAIKSQNVELMNALALLTTKVTELDVEVKKSQVQQRGQGVGSQTQIKTEDELFEENPIEFITQKSTTPDKLNAVHKLLITELSKKLFMEGLTSDKE